MSNASSLKSVMIIFFTTISLFKIFLYTRMSQESYRMVRKIINITMPLISSHPIQKLRFVKVKVRKLTYLGMHPILSIKHHKIFLLLLT